MIASWAYHRYKSWAAEVDGGANSIQNPSSVSLELWGQANKFSLSSPLTIQEVAWQETGCPLPATKDVHEQIVEAIKDVPTSKSR